MQITRTKQKELFYTTTKHTLEFPKVSINPTWKEGLHKIQVNYFGMVKLTNKRRRKATKTSIRYFKFSFINAKEKLPTKQSMQIRRIKKKEIFYTTTKQTLECPKVNINPTWKEGLHKIQVNYFGMVKLTNKRRRKATPTSFWNQTKATKRG